MILGPPRPILAGLSPLKAKGSVGCALVPYSDLGLPKWTERGMLGEQIKFKKVELEVELR